MPTESRAATKEDLQRETSRIEMVLRREIQEMKVDLLKRTFAFWIGNIAVLSGIMFTMLRAFTPR